MWLSFPDIQVFRLSRLRLYRNHKCFRSGNHPETRTNCRKKDTPFGKIYQFQDGVLFYKGGPYGGTTFQGWALRGLPLKLFAYREEAEHSSSVDEEDF